MAKLSTVTWSQKHCNLVAQTIILLLIFKKELLLIKNYFTVEKKK